MESLVYFQRWKRFYYQNLRDKLWKDEYIFKRLEPLTKAIDKSKKAFIENRSFEFCAKCAASGEKCCQTGLEWKLRPAEFIINLMLAELLKKEIKFNTERPEDCLFLGEKGCNLILTPVFCRNFFCDKLARFLGHERLVKIQHAMEEESVISFELAEYINRKYVLPNSEKVIKGSET